MSLEEDELSEGQSGNEGSCVEGAQQSTMARELRSITNSEIILFIQPPGGRPARAYYTPKMQRVLEAKYDVKADKAVTQALAISAQASDEARQLASSPLGRAERAQALNLASSKRNAEELQGTLFLA
ncbi:hypothetical protein HDU90_000699 [Geranomyces variabilis]|nr:hypothetical protein HDU90_000699 [Geranomyces variabilis]